MADKGPQGKQDEKKKKKKRKMIRDKIGFNELFSYIKTKLSGTPSRSSGKLEDVEGRRIEIVDDMTRIYH